MWDENAVAAVAAVAVTGGSIYKIRPTPSRMPNGGYAPHRPAIVSVLGIGGAGRRMLEAVRETASNVDSAPQFEYVAIDTDEEVRFDFPPDVETIHLELPTEHWQQNRGSYGYLTEVHELPVMGGTRRQRAVGRYSVDNRQTLADFYDRLVEIVTPDSNADVRDGVPGDHHVWVLSSLGGGTGSGLFPLIAVLLDEILPRETFRFGLGALPVFDEYSNRHTSRGHRSCLNAYAALREIRVLLGEVQRDPYPLEIGLEAGPSGSVPGRCVLEESPLDAYGLFGLDPEQLEDHQYLEETNRIVGDAVVAVATTTSFIEALNGLYPMRGTDGTPFSVDGSGLEVIADSSEKRPVTEDELPTARSERYMSVPLRPLADDGANVPIEIGSLAGLSDEAPIDTVRLRALIRGQLERLDEPVRHSRQYGNPSEIRTDIAAFTDVSNRRLVEDAGKKAGVPDGDGNGSISVVESPNGLSVRFLAQHTSIRLDDVSTFDVLHDHYDDPQKDVADCPGFSAYQDEDVTNAFAYPELLSDATR